MSYKRPYIEVFEASADLLSSSGPQADDIFPPNVETDAKEYSIWDEVNKDIDYDI